MSVRMVYNGYWLYCNILKLLFILHSVVFLCGNRKQPFMKHTLLTLFILFSTVFAQAQERKHRVYADVGYPLGLSVTYNYRLAKHWGAGAGFQGYRVYKIFEQERTILPGVYGDIRFNFRPEKRGQFMLFLDMGINLYRQDKSYYRDSVSVYNIPRNNGLYTGLGMGYLRRINERGNALYFSIKPILNWVTVQRYFITEDERSGVWVGAKVNVALSIGFLF